MESELRGRWLVVTRDNYGLVSKLMLGLVVGVMSVLYITMGKQLGIYHWAIGLVFVLVAAVSFGSVYASVRELLRLTYGAKCPHCHETLNVREELLKGQIEIDGDMMPAVVDKISTCPTCGKENHFVYTPMGEVGDRVPLTLQTSWGEAIHDKKSIQRLLRPGMSEEEIEAVMKHRDSIKTLPSTKSEWDEWLAEVRREADKYNTERGIVIKKKK